MYLSIGRKLLFSFGLVGLLIAVAATIAWWSQVRAQATQNEITQTYALLNDIEHLNSNMNRATALQRTYLVSGDAKDIAPLTDLRANAKTVLARLTDAIKDDPDQIARLGQFKSFLQQRSKLVDQLFALRRNQGFDAAKSFFDSGDDSRLFGAMQSELDEIKSDAARKLAGQLASEESVRRRVVWTESLAHSCHSCRAYRYWICAHKVHSGKCSDRHSPGY